MKKATDEQVAQWQSAMLNAYRETGNIGTSCELAGISSIRHKRWLHTHPDYARQIDLITELRSAQGLKSKYQTGSGRPIDVDARRDQQERFLEAYGRLGVASLAFVASGVSARSHYRWLREDESYPPRFFEIETRVKADGTMARNRKPSGAHTPEQRENVRQGALRRQANMTPKQKTANRAQLLKASSVIKGGRYITSIEAKTAMALNDRDVAYQLHKTIGDYVADIYVPEAFLDASLSLDIECDGSAFHDDSTTRREADRDAALLDIGVIVLRLTEAEINASDFTRLDRTLGIE